MRIRIARQSGFTLVEIMIVVAIIGLLAAIAIPNFVKAREAAQRTACTSNLRAIDGAKATWALEQKRSSTDTPAESDLCGPALYLRGKPACPANGSYAFNQVDAKPVCSVATHTL